MATKKQKTLQMKERRQQFEAEQRESGLKAQARDREYRERKRRKRLEEEEAEAARIKAGTAIKKINGKKKVKDG